MPCPSLETMEVIDLDLVCLKSIHLYYVASLPVHGERYMIN